MTDYQDHYYPSEMSVDALLQTFLIEQDGESLLADIDDEEELNAVYEQFMEELFEDDEEE